jgi:tetratricopeptide (TPR) repeat protein
VTVSFLSPLPISGSNVMAIKDYKGEDTYRSLGLRKGKAVIKREASPLTPKRLCMWLGLFALVAFVNYFVFVHLRPLHNKGPKLHQIKEWHKRADTFAECFDTGSKRYQEGDLKGSVEAYTEAISLKPEEIRSYFNRGIAYIELNMHDKAIDDYNTVIAMNPYYAEAYNNRGWAYLQKGLFDSAIRDCNKALNLDPNIATAYHSRGMAYKGKGMLEMAKRDFQKSCEMGDIHGCREYERLSNTGDHET